MNVALTNHYEDLIARLIKKGRFNNASEVVRAGLRRLEEEDEGRSPLVTAPVYPPGSLLPVYKSEGNAEEMRLLAGCTTRVEEDN